MLCNLVVIFLGLIKCLDPYQQLFLKMFKNGPFPALFSFFCRAFQTKMTIFTAN